MSDENKPQRESRGFERNGDVSPTVGMNELCTAETRSFTAESLVSNSADALLIAIVQ